MSVFDSTAWMIYIQKKKGNSKAFYTQIIFYSNSTSLSTWSHLPSLYCPQVEIVSTLLSMYRIYIAATLCSCPTLCWVNGCGTFHICPISLRTAVTCSWMWWALCVLRDLEPHTRLMLSGTWGEQASHCVETSHLCLAVIVVHFE